MKKLTIALIAAVLMMCLALSANAYIIKIVSASPDGSAAVAAGAVNNESNSVVPLFDDLLPEAAYALFEGNTIGGALVNHLRMNPGPSAWYGTVLCRGGYNGSIEVRFCSTTTASKLATGTWYVYKGIAQTAILGGKLIVTNTNEVSLLDSGTFTTSESYWDVSTFSTGTLTAGDFWTLTQAELVPEPGTLAVLLSGFAGIAGFAVRRRK